MQDRFFGRLLLVLLAGFTVCYTVYMTVRYLTPGYRTETAYSYTIADTCRIRVVAVRDEEVISSGVQGAYSYLRADGDVVLAQSAVADVYKSDEDLRAAQQIAQRESEIAALQSAAETEPSTVGDSLGTAISEEAGLLNDAVTKGELSDLQSRRDRIQLLLAKRLIASGKVNNFTVRIDTIRAEIASLTSRMSSPAEQVYAGTEGYFSSTVDGYEGILPTDTDLLTAAAVKSVADGTAQKNSYANAIGRIQHGFRWYLAAVVDSASAKQFTENASVTLDFGVSNATDIPARVCLVREEENSTLVVFECERINSYLINMRTANADVKFRSYTGLRISSEAVRYQDQIEGVYVRSGNLVEFKRIERIYEGDNYILCSETANIENPLEQFDEVIVEGSDLYDGKVIS